MFPILKGIYVVRNIFGPGADLTFWCKRVPGCSLWLVVGGNIEATILNLDIISFLQFLHYTLNVFFFEILSVKGLFDPCITKYRLVEVSGSVF